MSAYESFYNQVTIRGPVAREPNLPVTDEKRIPKYAYFYWLGKLGDPQVGPFYLGWSGIFSLLFGFAAFEIIGLNMAAQTDWNPMRFAQGIIWNGIDPPPAKYGRGVWSGPGRCEYSCCFVLPFLRCIVFESFCDSD